MSNRTNKPRWKNETNVRRARRFENGAKNVAASQKIGRVAKRALSAILLAGAFDGGTLLAQSIINETSVFNNRFETFSGGSVEKIARLDASPASVAPKDANAPSGSLSPSNKVDLRLDAPKGAPRENVGARLRVPFTFPKDADSKSATSVELFCSPDAGTTWYSYAGQRPEDGADAFVFQAPKPGVYWFALRTRFANGTAAFSSTRAYRFVEAPSTPTGDWATADETGDSASASSAAATALTDSENATAPSDSFALNDDSAEPDAPPLGTPSAASANGTEAKSNRLLDLARGAANGEKSNAGKENAEPDAPTQPATGKIKSVGPAKEKGTDRLILILRWFRPSEIEEEARRGRPATIAVERATSLDGPWTRVGENLDSERELFFWYATDAETTPFYVRTVATDDEGNQWVDAIPQPLDLSASWVQAALGSYKGPKFNVEKTPDDGTGDAKSDAENAPSDDGGKTEKRAKIGGGKLGGGNKRLIRNAASSTDSVDAEDANEESEESGKSGGSAKKAASTERAQASAPRRPRPNVPAPTNPNEFSLNPLFTQGFGVLFQAAQTRRGDGESDANRSIFTPPHRAPAASRVAPAEYANATASAARRRATAQAQDMSRYEKTPELMEGMVFYQDADGKLTTTPPADFQTSGVEGSIGGSFDASYPGVGGATTIGTGPDGRSLVLPGDNETYDANPNSAAATLTNPAYPNVATPGASPLNTWGTPSTGGVYPSGSYPANAAPSGSYPGNAAPSGAYPPSATYQTIPETSFGRNVLPGSTVGGSNAPTWNAPTNGGASSRSLFPPRPSVSR